MIHVTPQMRILVASEAVDFCNGITAAPQRRSGAQPGGLDAVELSRHPGGGQQHLTAGPVKQACRKDTNVFITGPPASGQVIWLVLAATVSWYSIPASPLYLFRDLALARGDGSLRSLLARLAKVDVLIADEWAMAPLQETERRDFWELCKERYQNRSTILIISYHRSFGSILEKHPEQRGTWRFSSL